MYAHELKGSISRCCKAMPIKIPMMIFTKIGKSILKKKIKKPPSFIEKTI